ncbi:hypothetical protein JRQ81_019307 [Phrynocephalus forsythii]|uniref:C3H1-type domain-containing protein n=1 Tax=Phrynocephalus forsythii TaxID=171643 RepID=A0A9Q0XLM6_9SAUR|nr:hypothetical protein JRQ81_019307 [Phrynocephalus forsythii]
MTQEALLDEQRARYINGHQSFNKTASEKMDQIDSFLVATDTTFLIGDEEVPQKTGVENVLMSGFLPRGKEQMINCTSLPQDFVNKVVLKVVQLVLSGSKESPPGNTTTWNRGESLTLGEIAEHLDKKTLKTLKNEYGGLQTLLKNNHQVFEVLNGKVHIRDWREWKPPRKNKRHEQAQKRFPSGSFKTRLCWFHMHHPQGCPLVSEFCHYAHGTAELKAPLAVPKINNVQQSSVASLTCCAQMS